MTIVQPTFRSPKALMAGAQDAWHRLFEHCPIPILLLTPDLKIVDGNDAYLGGVSRSRDTLAGLNMFDAFPDNPHLARADGVANLAESFGKVLHEKRGQVMPLQRYDIQPEGRPWQVRYWHPRNWPVIDDDGSIVAVVHHVTDATTAILVRKAGRAGPPPSSSETLLCSADRAILEAREIVRETREAILVSRASLEENVSLSQDFGSM
ncbi:PAS domain-containing protein [Bradyrhizobium sp. KB893862 SZCCT0404]|uniref:PAS domain-containing protein n=1 Tax=Bradyrhizobium sp. KB893862 SZCCT0404 TaxID=2807672 RepID=UPI001BA8F776|nr:PAS domain-containing protein [Bradyrhizobium sp. KB893862 SZCCT0404]MBR1178323.1 PAS domain-containing protein [Bradyrhizobium sp. KB893862 SZCCT0404]